MKKVTLEQYIDWFKSDETGTVVLELQDGDSVPQFASTSGRRVWGPATFVVTRHTDGGVDGEIVSDGKFEDQERAERAARILHQAKGMPYRVVGRGPVYYVERAESPVVLGSGSRLVYRSVQDLEV